MIKAKHLIKAGNPELFIKNRIYITLNLTDSCNFNCSYCCNSAWRKNASLPLDLLHDLIEDLGQKSYEEIVIFVSGGEPFLYPYLERMFEFISTLIPYKKIIKFITNGSLLVKNSSLIEKYINSLDMHFLCTAHLEKPYYIENIQSLATLSFKEKYFFKILMAPGQLQKAYNLVNEFSKFSISHYVATIFDNNLKTLNYNEEEIKYLKSFHYTNEVVLSHEYKYGEKSVTIPYYQLDKQFSPELFSYQGMYCACGMNALRVGSNGSLIPCFGAARKGHRYNLNKKRLADIPEFNKPIICPTEKCNCEIFLKIPKWKYEKYKPVYITT